MSALSEVTCAVFFGALDTVLQLGVNFVPGGLHMSTGMKTAIKGAKSLAENGEGPNAFGG
ncbi:hypothetical protein AJ79_00211 [Helicocarpus griseus UAMH5409]|uniref:Uncharacterized protein n=1 Tax=Helicocarpus griseus UAMH5409 TaxID=1447875 RepID=A0A2B7YD15_9EURO|nr:hypothetical protein AJ79_00211 [Helicocarpus griseus UAMH5409]